MLEFKQRNRQTDEIAPRWNVGVDQRHVAAYVALGVLGGFACGFLVARSLGRREVVAPPAISETRSGARQTAADTQSSDFHRVTRVVRADTIEVEGVGTVRMIGIETPDGKSPHEIYGVHGQRALSFVENSLLGKEVRLEFDSTNGGQGKDESGPMLAYVYTRDGTLINSEMVKRGLALVLGSEQFRLSSDFRVFEREAMQNMRGVWASSSSSTALASAPTSTATPAPLGDDKPKKLSPLPPSALGVNIPAISGSPSSSPEQSVWVSPADKMYHKSSCDFLDKKKRTVSLSQAKSEGYTACSRCYASTVLKAP